LDLTEADRGDIRSTGRDVAADRCAAPFGRRRIATIAATRSKVNVNAPDCGLAIGGRSRAGEQLMVRCGA
jgi:hypothetical protein